MPKRISHEISYIPATENPLSGDIGIIRGEKKTYLFDVGNGEESLRKIKELSGEKAIIISHFHPDHMGNLKMFVGCGICEEASVSETEHFRKSTVSNIDIYAGANTSKYIHICGDGKPYKDTKNCKDTNHCKDTDVCKEVHNCTLNNIVHIVEREIYIEDGVKLHIFPLPACHAKGSLGLEVNDTYAFLGDATYATMKDGKAVYNAGILLEEIKALEGLRAEYFLISHEENFLQKKDVVIRQLKEIYSKRVKNSPYITVTPP